VRDGRLPEPIGVEGEADVIAEHFPEINDAVTVEIPAAHIMELERVKEVKKKAEAEIERLEAEIRMLMGDAKFAKGGGYTVTRSRYERVSPCYVKAEAKAKLEAAGIEYTGGGMAIVDTLRVKRDKGGK
jgi:predicted nucleic acid-binding Zn ribbon protein